MTAVPADIGDFIQYADFQIDASIEPFEDEVTVEAEPDMVLINELMYGNVSLNESLHIIPSGNKAISTVYYTLKTFSST